jgi:hypothetical protein
MGSRAHLSLALDLTLRPRVLTHPPSRVARFPDDGPRLHARIMTRSLRVYSRTLAQTPERRSSDTTAKNTASRLTTAISCSWFGTPRSHTTLRWSASSRSGRASVVNARPAPVTYACRCFVPQSVRISVTSANSSIAPSATETRITEGLPPTRWRRLRTARARALRDPSARHARAARARRGGRAADGAVERRPRASRACDRRAGYSARRRSRRASRR